jgi:transketolase
MDMSPMFHVLFTRVLRYDPADPKWVRTAIAACAELL